MKNKKILLFVSVSALLFLLITVTGTYLLLTKTQTGEKILCSINNNFCASDKPTEKEKDIGPIDVKDPDDKPNNPTGSQNYPILLPDDMPFTIDDMTRLSEKAKDRIHVSYSWDKSKTNWSEDQFIEYIDPYLTVYLASMEYSFEKYGNIFIGQNPSLEDREDLWMVVYEKCTDMSMGYSEEACADVKMIGSVSPFTYRISFYVNPQHKDYSNEFLLDVGMHETIHLLQYTYDEGYAGSTIPTWYKESMAVGLAYSSPAKMALYKKDYDIYGAPKSVKELNEWFNAGGDTLENLGKMRSAYYIGGRFFKFLMESVELKEYLKIMPKQFSTWPDRNEFEKAFVETFDGKGSEEMYQEFLKNLDN